jgi:hypothetical protein
MQQNNLVKQKPENINYVYLLLAILLLPFLGPVDLVRAQQADQVSFKRHVLSREFISEGVAVGDINNDGLADILAGAFYFLAPDWERHELAPSVTFKANGGYSNSFVNYVLDVNQDGWNDFIRIDEPGKEAVWYENPKGKSGHWRKHMIHEYAGNETPISADVNGDGRLDLIFNDPVSQQMLWFKAPVKKGDTEWKKFVISDDAAIGTHKYTHGLGYGDINGDGYDDVIIKEGWWQGPSDPEQEHWTFHPADLGEDCAHMIVLDVNGDGLNDLITSSAHKYGIWWHEQVKNKDGSMSWKTHEIFSGFSQSHALALQDINGDGHPDLVTGKRYFAHNGGDPGAQEPAVLYWFEFRPGKAPSWIPHQIDADSGVGIHLVVEDVNADGVPDIVVANKKGVHYFEQLNKR